MGLPKGPVGKFFNAGHPGTPRRLVCFAAILFALLLFTVSPARANPATGDNPFLGSAPSRELKVLAEGKRALDGATQGTSVGELKSQAPSHTGKRRRRPCVGTSKKVRSLLRKAKKKISTRSDCQRALKDAIIDLRQALAVCTRPDLDKAKLHLWLGLAKAGVESCLTVLPTRSSGTTARQMLNKAEGLLEAVLTNLEATLPTPPLYDPTSAASKAAKPRTNSLGVDLGEAAVNVSTQAAVKPANVKLPRGVFYSVYQPAKGSVPLKALKVNYCFNHVWLDGNSYSIKYDHSGCGGRVQSHQKFSSGIFSAKVQCPLGNTNGLVSNLYLSSQEGDKHQDEIDFEFLGRDKRRVQTNYYVNGIGKHEFIVNLGFDCSSRYYTYAIFWNSMQIRWFIEGRLVRTMHRKRGYPYPGRPQYLYSSIWNGAWVNKGRWAGHFYGHDMPYYVRYKDVIVAPAYG